MSFKEVSDLIRADLERVKDEYELKEMSVFRFLKFALFDESFGIGLRLICCYENQNCGFYVI